eukprot:jgi/Mesvir1/24489/Mv21844-RA.1
MATQSLHASGTGAALVPQCTSLGFSRGHQSNPVSWKCHAVGRPGRASIPSGQFLGKHLLQQRMQCRQAAGKSQQAGHVIAMAAPQEREPQKVSVQLGQYLGLEVTAPAIKVTLRGLVDAAAVDKALEAKQKKTHDFKRINFTGSGAKLGLAVVCDFEGVFADTGKPIPGTKAAGYELDLVERPDEPWKSFVEQIVVKGMGQEETKSFEVTFPDDFKAPPLRGKKARFTLTVHAIGRKEPIAPDTRPLDVQRTEIEARMRSESERASNDVVDRQLREKIQATSDADTQKIADSVSWAKFGTQSMKDFKWNLIKEEIARKEGIDFKDVMDFLRKSAKVTYQ